MAEEVFQKARGRTLSVFREDVEKEWKAPFYFIQGADPQFGLMKAYAIGDCDSGGDEWDQELKLTQQAVQAVNQLDPKPKFFVICGDLVHGMPGTPWREAQTRDLKNVLKGLRRDVPAVFVSGNHDLGNVPTPETIDDYCRQWGDDYFAFWVGGVFFLVLNSQLYFDHSKCPEQKKAQDAWLAEQLALAGKRACKHAVVFQHIPLFLKSPDEEQDYFNLEKSVRQELLDRFRQAGFKTRLPALDASPHLSTERATKTRALFSWQRKSIKNVHMKLPAIPQQLFRVEPEQFRTE
ncbi:serine/threonine-protein phosphatase CPPED1 isoform X2 [Sphaerodactylus townsendi]|uniref:serine/threonine-protein phosphatase CPPED1 isoform X2 n=1 Tax=Sphaerodactylus townsendi TaxID=933632 RepID=UPI002026D79A|nr:serine/threonine-protein phosphatase CPPED1 isoform X2 [Sphaerodactylus townsendi]